MTDTVLQTDDRVRVTRYRQTDAHNQSTWNGQVGKLTAVDRSDTHLPYRVEAPVALNPIEGSVAWVHDVEPVCLEHFTRYAISLDTAARNDVWVWDPAPLSPGDYCNVGYDGYACSRPERHVGQHIAGDGSRVLKTWPSDMSVEISDRVRVTQMNERSGPYLRCVGRTGHVRDVTGRSATPYEVVFDDGLSSDSGSSSDYMPSTAYVRAVERIDVLDGIQVGGFFAGEPASDKRCNSWDTGSGVYCSRTAHDDDDRHVGAAEHRGEVLGMWGKGLKPSVEIAATTLKPGDVVICSADAKTASGGGVYFDGEVEVRIESIWTDPATDRQNAEVIRTDTSAPNPQRQTVGVAYLRRPGDLAATPDTRPANADRVAELEAEVARLTSRIADHETWKQTLAEDAHRMADREGYCSDFDRFMTEHDLPGRARTYQVRTHVTVEVTVEVSAPDSDEAIDAVDVMDRDVIAARLREQWEAGSVTIEEIDAKTATRV